MTEYALGLSSWEFAMNEKDNRRLILIRLARIVVIVAVLFLGLIGLHPERYLPPDMSFADFLQGLLGSAILAGVLAAAVYRAWHDAKNKRNKK
jgi:hypothetical membrane protein